MEPGKYPGLTSGEYDQIPAVRSSHIKILKHGTPAHLKQEMDEGRGDTAAQSKGTAAHHSILEPEEFGKRVILSKYAEFRSNEAKAWRDAQKDKGLIVLKKPDYDGALTLSRAVYRHEHAAKLLRADGQNELSIVWDDQGTGVRCKARLDMVRVVEHTVVSTGEVTPIMAIPDLKTTAFVCDDDRLARMAGDFDWPIQEAFYRRGLVALYGDQPRLAPFIVVENKPPHCVRVAYMDSDDVQKADAFITAKLRVIAECQATRKWPAWQDPDGVTVVTLKPWAWANAGLEE